MFTDLYTRINSNTLSQPSILSALIGGLIDLRRGIFEYTQMGIVQTARVLVRIILAGFNNFVF